MADNRSNRQSTKLQTLVAWETQGGKSAHKTTSFGIIQESHDSGVGNSGSNEPTFTKCFISKVIRIHVHPWLDGRRVHLDGSEPRSI